MTSRIYTPGFPLSQFIEYFYYYSGFQPAHSIDRFLPNGDVQILFDLTEVPKYIYDNDTLQEIQSCKKVWFSGFRTEPITIPSGRESEMILVQFKKGKAFPFLNAPMQHLTNQVVDGELVIKSEILEIRERLLTPETPIEKLLLLERALLNHHLDHLQENPFVDFAIQKIISAPNQCSIREIADKVGFSQKHTIKLFKEKVGVTPKEFLKVIRFQKVIQQIEQHQTIKWTAIAHDCGYYDQSHFIADFKKFSGYTPVQYVKMKGDMLNYIPVK